MSMSDEPAPLSSSERPDKLYDILDRIDCCCGGGGPNCWRPRTWSSSTPSWSASILGSDWATTSTASSWGDGTDGRHSTPRVTISRLMTMRVVIEMIGRLSRADSAAMSTCGAMMVATRLSRIRIVSAADCASCTRTTGSSHTPSMMFPCCSYSRR